MVWRACIEGEVAEGRGRGEACKTSKEKNNSFDKSFVFIFPHIHSREHRVMKSYNHFYNKFIINFYVVTLSVFADSFLFFTNDF